MSKFDKMLEKFQKMPEFMIENCEKDPDLIEVYEKYMEEVTDNMCNKIFKLLYTSILSSQQLLPFQKKTFFDFGVCNQWNDRFIQILIVNTAKDIRVGISIAILNDQPGNRFGKVYENDHTRLHGNPDTVHISICHGPSDLKDSIVYRNGSEDENGFSDVIKEIVRIHNIVISL